MTKKELQNIFPDFAKTAIKKFDDGYELAGKFVRVVQLDNNYWDVWICNINDLVTGLTEYKLSGLLDSTQPYPEIIGILRRLNGEAIFQVSNENFDNLHSWLKTNRTRLGIKKRKVIDENAIPGFLRRSTGQASEKTFQSGALL